MSDIHEQAPALLAQLQAATDHAKKLSSYPSLTDHLLTPRALAEEAEAVAEDMGEVQDELLPDMDEPTCYSNDQETPVYGVTRKPVEFELWEAIAYDLALDYTDRQTVASGYNLTTAQLEALCENPYFAKMLKSKEEEIKQIGTDAAFVVKMRMVANRATPQFLRRLTDGATSTRDFHALFKTAVELAQLLPKQEEERTMPTISGTTVTFNIHGVPGLDHLMGKPADSPTVAPMDTDVIDAEFTDIIEYQSRKLSMNPVDDDELAEL